MCAPVLEDLTLGPPFSLITLPKLKVLRLTYETLPVPISSDALTSLTLTGGAEQWDLQRDDIHFPLETLSLRVTHPAVIAAIVAPKLGYFEYGTDWMGPNELCLTVFSDFGNKFGRVHPTLIPMRPTQKLHVFVGHFLVCVLQYRHGRYVFLPADQPSSR